MIAKPFLLPATIALLAAAPSAQPAEPHGAGLQRRELQRRAVRFVYEVENQGERPLRKIELRLVLPPELARQELLRLELRPGSRFVPEASSGESEASDEPAGRWIDVAAPEEKRDAYGNRVAVFRCPELAPGERFAGQWYAELGLRPTRILAPEQPLELPDAERRRYLRDAEVYGVEHEIVQRLAQQIAARELDGVAELRAIQDVVMDRLRYVRDGRWDPAPVCLERGTGSCSEYTYAFVALCRARGIPARWAGGLALRERDAETYTDQVFHRWAEAWLPEHGWVPVDCSRDDGEDRQGKRRPSTLGRLDWPLLVLARGDGDDALCGWSYHAQGQWSGRGGKSKKRGFWTRLHAAGEDGAPRRHPHADREFARFRAGEGVPAEAPSAAPEVRRSRVAPEAARQR